jgi:serine phosphatase RsbU (regulator of sigma subunit)/pSer/pThr/pTyr-binding forkhead associated (FHA) protein
MATLEVLLESKGKHFFELVSEQSIVGRENFCDIVIPSHTVSRQHARITRIDDAYYLEDLSSLNGTFVNGQRVDTRTRLRDKDRIHIYEIPAVFHDRSPDEIERARLTDTPADGTPGLDTQRDHVSYARLLETEVPTAAVDNALQARVRATQLITETLGKSLELDELLPKILDSLFEIFPQAERGYLLLAEEPDGHLVPRAIKHRQGGTGLSMTFGPISRRTVARVMSEGESVLISSEQSPDAAQSVFDFQQLSMICVPLLNPSRQPLGIIYIDTNDPQRQFNREDLEVLGTVATVAGQAVEYAGDQTPGRITNPRERDLGTARQVQLHFLPQRPPEVPGYEFFDYYLAADEVGGDYFGYVRLADGRLALAVGDVEGKGVAAALLMAQLCAEVRFCLTSCTSPAAAVEQLNRNLSTENLGYRFITFVLCVLDPRTHTLSIVNAGHMPPLRRRGGTRMVEELGADDSGLPLGCDLEKGYGQTDIKLEPGDAIAVYTDGISEAMNAQGELFGAAAIRREFAKGSAQVEQLGENLLRAVEAFVEDQVQTDDICLVCFARSQR